MRKVKTFNIYSRTNRTTQPNQLFNALLALRQSVFSVGGNKVLNYIQLGRSIFATIEAAIV